VNGPLRRLKSALHPHVDPMLSRADHWRARRELRTLPDGIYRAPASVPYRAQYASPGLIHSYIHAGYDGAQDPNWHAFGADNPAEYAFWAPRICALACLQMAIAAYRPADEPPLWQLVKEGLDLRGYTLRDANGNWIDEGWSYPALVALAARYGIRAQGQGYASVLRVCASIRRGVLVMASVTPELGERVPQPGRYGGHFVLVLGFAWRRGAPLYFELHNPSGRYAELRAHAIIPADRFRAAYAYRLIALSPLHGPASDRRLGAR